MAMLRPTDLDAFALLDTTRQHEILVKHQVLDTPAGDRVLGHLAGAHPERYTALIASLARGDV